MKIVESVEYSSSGKRVLVTVGENVWKYECTEKEDDAVISSLSKCPKMPCSGKFIEIPVVHSFGVPMQEKLFKKHEKVRIFD